jgi:hypothetical protein
MGPEELTPWLRRLSAEVESTNANYTPNLVRGCPIPFFGDVLKARVLTVGVNPSSTEFVSTRQWRLPPEDSHLQERLLTYFTCKEAEPHEWFETWSICLDLLGMSYLGGVAAHIDISPRPTWAMFKNPKINHRLFRTMVESDVKWFFELLGNLPQVRLLMVAGPIPGHNGAKQQLADFVHEQCSKHNSEWLDGEPMPRLVTSSHPKGIPVFVCPYEPGVDGEYAIIRHTYRNREILRGITSSRKTAEQVHKNVYPGGPSEFPEKLRARYSGTTSGATISDCGLYRYDLWRIWDQSKPHVLFIGLNPSIADASQDDPTVRRCIDYVKRWEQFGGFYLCNLFAFRATERDDMQAASDPVGPENDAYIRERVSKAQLVIGIWGDDGAFQGRSTTVRPTLPNLHCFKINQTGEPGHLLYLSATLKPFPYKSP